MSNQKKITVLGSTGSIGVQTLDVARELGADIIALTANRDVEKIYSQIAEFRPLVCAMNDEQAALELSGKLKRNNIKCEVLSGEEGVANCAEMSGADTCVAAIVGIAGLAPVVKAINSGKNIALANKETLVTAGEYINAIALENNVSIFPIDSEHSAIFQCLEGNNISDVEKIIITASGGPFRGLKSDELKNVMAKDALKHPTWNMGAKITIDSATLMNKGLEVIEASWLFNMPVNRIKPVVHPQSIIHSMVEYKDGSVMAQMGTPDMRLPISLSLTWPRRVKNNFSKLDLIKCSALTFEEPDMETFRCLALAYEAMKAGGTMPAAMNGANEICVEFFLNGQIKFLEIAELIEAAMENHVAFNAGIKDINDVKEADAKARHFIKNRVGGV